MGKKRTMEENVKKVHKWTKSVQSGGRINGTMQIGGNKGSFCGSSLFYLPFILFFLKDNI